MSRLAPAWLMVAALVIPAGASADAGGPYRWLAPDAHTERLDRRIPPPRGAYRVEVARDSFGAWLRGLPVRAPGTPVRSFRGELLHDGNDKRIAAVVEIDVGSRDLQQCADAVIRTARWSER